MMLSLLLITYTYLFKELVVYDSYYNGSRYTFAITKMTYYTMPNWDLRDDNPPLTIRKLIDITNRQMTLLLGGPIAVKWKIKSIELVPYNKKWYWRVVYMLPWECMKDTEDITSNFTIIVLMNGYVLDPHITKSKSK